MAKQNRLMFVSKFSESLDTWCGKVRKVHNSALSCVNMQNCLLPIDKVCGYWVCKQDTWDTTYQDIVYSINAHGIPISTIDIYVFEYLDSGDRINLYTPDDLIAPSRTFPFEQDEYSHEEGLPNLPYVELFRYFRK